ncbi:(5-formylfuran-3-yl)methyl phosphate synthase [Methylomonas rhizoryzae]|uniref:(5-formylfuran-3-yl)methyl phosphate synthase n=1 Tax=Methylomonas rhizoryzae TaxID=2608981 RepID=UPI001231C7D5|nr:(5-formylfuran-3-yl)methyl phosphate synthase [Methylomonas rhizoryzae]
MTGMLASVNSLDEALLVAPLGVDIIDLKQPAHGALGALPVAEVARIVTGLPAACVVSATVGDLPMEPAVLLPAVQAMAETGVDFIKIGFFPGGDWQACLTALSAVTERRIALVAVLFADSQPDFGIIAQLRQAGFRGVMLDTADKRHGSLTEAMDFAALQKFTEIARNYHLLTGLAGSLKVSDISNLLPLQADYLGFRGALCLSDCRTESVDASKVIEIKSLLPSFYRAGASLCGRHAAER